MIPHVNDHMSNIYKVYAPHVVKNPKYHKNKNNQNSLKNLEKYYEYYNIYKPNNNNAVNSRVNIIPNRKLSPIRNNNVL
jgi:hypothetical protein